MANACIRNDEVIDTEEIDNNEENQSIAEENNDNLEVKSDAEDELTSFDDNNDTNDDDLSIMEENNKSRDKSGRSEGNETYGNLYQDDILLINDNYDDVENT